MTALKEDSDSSTKAKATCVVRLHASYVELESGRWTVSLDILLLFMLNAYVHSRFLGGMILKLRLITRICEG